MDGILDRIVVFALVGLASGFASGLFGIGGGIDGRFMIANHCAGIV